MKKKTKFKSDNDRRRIFWILIFIFFWGATIHAYLFCSSFFKTYTKYNEKPIASITFKYKTAQRKFSNRAVWDRLRQDSPIYNGDTIHTSTDSEATIWFSDGNVMELSENTMAQVFMNSDKKLRADLESGTAKIDSSDSANGISLSSGGVQFEISAGSKISAESSAQGENKNVSLQVLKGNATSGNVEIFSGDSFSASGGETKKMQLSVLVPSANEKFLYFEKIDKTVQFQWKIRDADDDAKILLDVSADKNFSEKIFQEDVTGEQNFSRDFSSGNYYYKISVQHENEEHDAQEVRGKFSVIQSLPPNLISPAKEFSYDYRTRLPAVRFIWSESKLASSYRLLVADNPQMKNPKVDLRQDLTSTIISTLGEGVWYWNVTPFYTVNKTGFGIPSETGRFFVNKKGELKATKLLVPRNNGIVNTENSSRPVSFGWKSETEADEYHFVLAENSSFKNPVADLWTGENYFNLNLDEKKLADGKYFWKVSYKDFEGNVSEYSEPFSFAALKGNPEQHLVEPLDDYRVAKSLVGDTTFSWKMNLPQGYESRIEFSKDQSFQKIELEKKVSSGNLRDIKLDSGNYFWRLKSVNNSTGTELVTKARRLKVIDSLEKVEFVSPKERALAREFVPYKFEWKKIDGADFYKFALYDAKNQIVHEDVVEANFLTLNMFGDEWDDKEFYRAEVQAFSNSVPGVQSRLSGKLSKQKFQLAKLHPVQVISPQKNLRVDGIEAILNPLTAKWKSDVELSEARFLLRKKIGGKYETILEVPSRADYYAGQKIAPDSVKLDTKEGLKAGDYDILIRAFTLDNIDVSNTDERYEFRFTVLPLEKLPAPENFFATPKILDVEFMRNKDSPRQIIFSWDAVPTATDYFFALADSRGKILINENVAEGTRFVLNLDEMSAEEKMQFLSEKFLATVEAVLRVDVNGDGKFDKILLDGEKSSAEFESTIPSTQKVKIQKAKNLYGM